MIRPKPKQKLVEMVKANKPLIEVAITLQNGEDSEEIIQNLNELADDLVADYSVLYAVTGNRRCLTVETTPEALYQLFGWEIKRINLDRWNPETKRYEGVWDNAYRWEAVNTPTKWPSCLDGKVD
jgi:hypothetical protein